MDDPIKAKIEKIAKTVYGADGVEYSKEALLDIKHAERNGIFKHIQRCIVPKDA